MSKSAKIKPVLSLPLTQNIKRFAIFTIILDSAIYAENILLIYGMVGLINLHVIMTQREREQETHMLYLLYEKTHYFEYRYKVIMLNNHLD